MMSYVSSGRVSCFLIFLSLVLVPRLVEGSCTNVLTISKRVGYNDVVNGDYIYDSTLNARSYYKGYVTSESTYMYVYYYNSRWYVGTTLGSTTCYMYAESTASEPMGLSPWKVYDGSSFVADYGIQVTCGSGCIGYTPCGACTSESSCGWCASTSTCYPGSATGPSGNTCSNWKYTASSCPRADCSSYYCGIGYSVASSVTCTGTTCTDAECCRQICYASSVSCGTDKAKPSSTVCAGLYCSKGDCCEGSGSNTNIGAIVGGVVGGVLGLSLLCCLFAGIVYLYQKKKADRDRRPSTLIETAPADAGDAARKQSATPPPFVPTVAAATITPDGGRSNSLGNSIPQPPPVAQPPAPPYVNTGSSMVVNPNASQQFQAPQQAQIPQPYQQYPQQPAPYMPYSATPQQPLYYATPTAPIPGVMPVIGANDPKHRIWQYMGLHHLSDVEPSLPWVRESARYVSCFLTNASSPQFFNAISAILWRAPSKQPMPQLTRVKIFLHQDHRLTFMSEIQNLASRRKSGSSAFNPDPGALSEMKARVVTHLKQQLVAVMDGASTLWCWHGASDIALASIIDTGFANLRRTDGNFFGSGVYLTLEPEYAMKYARMNRDLVSVTPDIDYPNKNYPGHFYSNFFADKNSKVSTSLVTGYDAHYVPVRINPSFAYDDYQACDPDVAEFHEMVISHESRILPIAALWFKD